jgi:site-specific DNA-methyltransferase (adenine-specific)
LQGTTEAGHNPMTIHTINRVTIHEGDCLQSLRTMPDESVHCVVTDPPYGLSFMGKRWDYDVPTVEVWQECLRVLKPGGHLLAFAGTRTQHRMAVRIEDAGFEIRDLIAWCYGSGFPKSLDVSKAIDKAAGAEREVVGSKVSRQPTGNAYAQDEWTKQHSLPQEIDITAPATEAAKQWAGWGTSLKPSFEPVTVARKPLCGTVAENVLQHGTGGLNVDGCRVAATGESLHGGGSTVGKRAENHNEGWQRPWMKDEAAREAMRERSAASQAKAEQLGRWPANLIHDGSDEVVGLFPETASGGGDKTNRDVRGEAIGGIYGTYKPNPNPRHHEIDTGSAARFFYCAKADASERRNSKHPTVKPLALMRYLCRLVCPPDGIVLDPFCGSGTTLEAARLEGFGAIGCELNPEYIADCKERLRQGVLF